MPYARLLVPLFAVLALWACGAKKKVAETTNPTNSDSSVQTPSRPSPKPETSWAPPLGDSIRHEMRAVWLTTAYGLDWPKVKADTPNGIRRQKEELERILDRLVADGYNTIFFQARLSGSVNYYSNEPFNRVFTSDGRRPDYDPLEFAVEACHKRGLAIHAWLVTYPLSGIRGVPHPLARTNPSWAIRHMGSRHLDPGVPGVRTYIAKLSADLARRYAVDGLHFDYFRYPEEAQRFNDGASYIRYGAGMDKSSWRRDNLVKQLAEIRDSVLRVRPEVQLSVAPLGKLRKIETLGRAHGWTAYDDVYQDVEEWAKRRLVDFVVPMMYYKDLLYEPFLRDWQARVGRYIPVVAGLAPYRVDSREEKYPWNAEVIAEQIRLARLHKAGGVAMFREAHIGPKYPYLRTLIQREFKQLSLLPPLPRGLEQKPAQPKDLHLKVHAKQLHLSWQMPQDYDRSKITYRVWATTTHPNGRRESVLLVQGLKDTQCVLKLNSFDIEDCLELGVEAVNSFGVSTPCDRSVEFNLLQDRILQDIHRK